ncbi:DUF3443 domain-containing protein [Mucilaginibacter sp. BJC16-A38]|uniref:DUF3443 domain-containing protein n=1 Tax=Mucilaginibacter phenanthrenivorans TaxID=1234842 RepID=UPI0021588986|nr:DUF3443 domain-containing protein [Mucilaginibacter phenanthrenivorans]MCR8560415.1 DUF3443 domain-containing protein [Mucilaginibacter phenanthrenivorans]
MAKFNRKPLSTILLLIILITAGQSCNSHDNRFILPAHPHDAKTVVPLLIYYVSQTDVRPAITVYINGIPVEVLFDTGSWGLRVLKGALKGGTFPTIGVRVSNSYSGGTSLYGQVARGYVSMSNSHKGATLNFMLIDGADSGNGKFSTGDNAVINNPLLEHFNGIIGVGMRYSDTSRGVANPLPQLPGNAQFIVHFPHYGEPEGTLVLNPGREDLRGFSFLKLKANSDILPNGLQSWPENLLTGTVSIDGQPYTKNTLLDTGNPLNFYYKDGTSNKEPVDINSVVRFSLGDPVVADTTITVKQQRAGLDLLVSSNKSSYGPRNVFGTMFFFDFDVFYDQHNGVIGIRKK